MRKRNIILICTIFTIFLFTNNYIRNKKNLQDDLNIHQTTKTIKQNKSALISYDTVSNNDTSGSIDAVDTTLKKISKNYKKKINRKKISEKVTDSKKYASTGKNIPIDSVQHRGNLKFSTENVKLTSRGLEITFAITNPQKNNNITIKDVIPSVIFKHHYLLPQDRSKDTTISKEMQNDILTALKVRKRKPFIVPGFPTLGASVVDDIKYNLKPMETNYFTVEIIPNHKVPAILATGFKTRYLNEHGEKIWIVSDNIFIVNVHEKIEFAKLNLEMLIDRIKNKKDYNFNNDVNFTMPCNNKISKEIKIINPQWDNLFRGSLDFLRDWDK